MTNTVVALTGMLSIFPLLIYNIIPSRTATAYTGIGIAIWAAVTFTALGAGAFISIGVVTNSGKNGLRSAIPANVRQPSRDRGCSHSGLRPGTVRNGLHYRPDNLGCLTHNDGFHCEKGSHVQARQV